jgi:hypothetical protein
MEHVGENITKYMTVKIINAKLVLPRVSWRRDPTFNVTRGASDRN